MRLSSPRVALVIIAAAVIVRFATLAHHSLWLDESFSVLNARAHTVAELWSPGIDPIHPPLFYIVLHGSLSLLGTSEVAARLPSAIASCISIALIWWLGQCLFPHRRVGIVAAVLLALSPIDLWYAQEARMYEMVAMSALLVAVGTVLDRRWSPVLIFIGLLAGLYFDHTMWPLAIFVLCAGLAWWWRDDNVGQIFKIGGGVAAAVPFLGPVWRQAAIAYGELDRVSLFRNLSERFGIGSVAALPLPLMMALCTVVVLVVVSVAALMLRNERVHARIAVPIVWAFALATIALAVPRAYSLKQVLVTGWPFVIVSAAWAIDQANSDRSFITVAGISAIAFTTTFFTPRADWRGVANHLAVHCTPWSVIVVDPPYNEQPLTVYNPGRNIVKGPISSAADLAQPEFDVKQACLVAERFSATQPRSSTERWMNENLELQSATSFARLELRCYRVGE